MKTPAVSRECFGNDLEHRSPASSSAACDPFRGPPPADFLALGPPPWLCTRRQDGWPHPLQESEALERVVGGVEVLVLKHWVLRRVLPVLLRGRHAQPPRAEVQRLGLASVGRLLGDQVEVPVHNVVDVNRK